MSLIHDALRKVGKEIGGSGPLPPMSGPEGPLPPQKISGGKKKRLLLFAGALGFGGVILGIVLFSHGVPPSPKEVPLPPPLPEQALPLPESAPSAPTEPPPTPLILNGIVQGEGESFAVINNQISRVGDEMEGVVLVEIGRNFIVLERGEEKIILKLK